MIVCDQLKKAIGHHRHQINANFSDVEMLVAEHKSLVTQVEKLADPQYRSNDNKEDRLSDLSYGAPPRTSSGLSFHGGASPIPIPVPALASSIPGPSSGLPSSSESSLDKENSAPGTQQSVVTELVAVIEEDHLDIGGETIAAAQKIYFFLLLDIPKEQ